MIEIERTPLPTPVVSEGKELRDRVSALTCRGLLPADQFDSFGVMLKVPDGHPGSLYLPVRQTCGDQIIEWSEIPAEGQSWGALKLPAPVIALAPATGRHTH